MNKSITFPKTEKTFIKLETLKKFCALAPAYQYENIFIKLSDVVEIFYTWNLNDLKGVFRKLELTVRSLAISYFRRRSLRCPLDNIIFFYKIFRL